MAATMAADPNEDPQAANQAEQGVDAPDLRWFVFALFFIFGGITSLNDVIIPKLKELFTLNYGQALLIQSAFFAAYALVSIPAAALVRRIGYLRAATVGLAAMMLGCLLFVPASSSAVFGLFLMGAAGFAAADDEKQSLKDSVAQIQAEKTALEKKFAAAKQEDKAAVRTAALKAAAPSPN